MNEPFKFGCIVGDEHFCPRLELQKQLTKDEIAFIESMIKPVE